MQPWLAGGVVRAPGGAPPPPPRSATTMGDERAESDIKILDESYKSVSKSPNRAITIKK